MSIESVMPSNHILCRSLLFLPSIFPNMRVFSNELALHIRWPKYRSFTFRISSPNEYSGLIYLRIDWFDLLVVQGTLRSSPKPQFESTNSSAFSLLYGPTLTFIHDYWKNHSFDDRESIFKLKSSDSLRTSGKTLLRDCQELDESGLGGQPPGHITVQVLNFKGETSPIRNKKHLSRTSR